MKRLTKKEKEAFGVMWQLWRAALESGGSLNDEPDLIAAAESLKAKIDASK
jgi:hypothetical protein